MTQAAQLTFSAIEYFATCTKNISRYKQGGVYRVYIDNVFSKVPLTPEEKDEQDKKNCDYKPDFNYKQMGRKCIYNRLPGGEAGYLIFESKEELNDHFQLKIAKVYN